MFLALPGAVEAAGVVLEEPDGAEGVVDEAGASEALLACLGCMEQPWLAFALILACLKA